MLWTHVVYWFFSYNRFQIDQLVTYNGYYMTLTVKECYGTTTPCTQVVDVLARTFIPEEGCPLNRDFVTPGKLPVVDCSGFKTLPETLIFIQPSGEGFYTTFWERLLKT